jgi:putative ABC transport system substrate-binding protein
MLAGFVSAGVVAGGVPEWFRAASAQQQSLPVIGVLDVVRGRFAAETNRGLAENGFVEGRNFKFESGHSEYRADLLAMNAAELVQRKAALILACSNRAALAAKSVTNTTPIIFLADDPVTAGLVDRLTRPGGNLTGVANPDSALIAGRIEIARELFPAMNLVVLVTDPTNKPTHDMEIREAQTAAKAFGLELSIIAWTGGSFEIELAALPRDRKAVLVFGGGPLFLVHGAQLDYLARRYEFPAIHGSREAVEEGALVSFGARFSDGGHLMGVYAARVLRGDKPADLPVRQITRTELVINLWGAKSLRLKVCPTLLARADEVIG